MSGVEWEHAFGGPTFVTSPSVHGRYEQQGLITIRGDLADDMETQMLPLIETGLPVRDQAALARHPGMLRRVLTALHSL